MLDADRIERQVQKKLFTPVSAVAFQSKMKDAFTARREELKRKQDETRAAQADLRFTPRSNPSTPPRPSDEERSQAESFHTHASLDYQALVHSELSRSATPASSPSVRSRPISEQGSQRSAADRISPQVSIYSRRSSNDAVKDQAASEAAPGAESMQRPSVTSRNSHSTLATRSSQSQRSLSSSSYSSHSRSSSRSHTSASSSSSGGSMGSRSRSSSMDSISSGTRLVNKTKGLIDVFESADSHYAAGHIKPGEAVIASGPVVEIDGHLMVPLKPQGAAELSMLRRLPVLQDAQLASLIFQGTVLVNKSGEEATVFKSLRNAEAIGRVLPREWVVAGGAAEDIDGWSMVPIMPEGAVQACLFAVVHDEEEADEKKAAFQKRRARLRAEAAEAFVRDRDRAATRLQAWRRGQLVRREFEEVRQHVANEIKKARELEIAKNRARQFDLQQKKRQGKAVLQAGISLADKERQCAMRIQALFRRKVANRKVERLRSQRQAKEDMEAKQKEQKALAAELRTRLQKQEKQEAVRRKKRDTELKLRQAEQRAREEDQAARCIQARFRGNHDRQVFHEKRAIRAQHRQQQEAESRRRQRAAMEKKLAAMEAARAAFQSKQEDWAVRRLQAVFRGRREREAVNGKRRVLDEERKRQERKQLAAQLRAKEAARAAFQAKQEDWAVRRLQALYRGCRDREATSAKKREIDEARRKEERKKLAEQLKAREAARAAFQAKQEDWAVRRLQALFRGSRAREAAAAKKNTRDEERRRLEAKKLAQQIRAKEAAAEALLKTQKDWAARRIQSRFRGRKEREAFALKRARREEELRRQKRKQMAAAYRSIPGMCSGPGSVKRSIFVKHVPGQGQFLVDMGR